MKENSVRKNRVGTAVALVAASLLPCVAVAVEAQSLGVLDPEDTTRYLSVGAQIFKGDLVKQGTGTNALSQADIHTGKGRVVVADGVLSLTGATTANQPPKPLSILSNAVVWLDASLPGTIDLVEGSSVNVSQWRDVRETGDGTGGSPYQYWRAVSYTNLEHSATYAPDSDAWFPTYSPANEGENAYVDFGQYSSGRTMRFRDSSGNLKRVEYLRHVFVVLGTHDGHYGFVFDPGSGNTIYVPQSYGNLVRCEMNHFIQSSAGWSVLLSGVFRVDGVAVDPVNDAKPNGGYQLLDIIAGKDGWRPQGFFSHNNTASDAYGYRQGGGRLCEAILFNKPLDERDRVKVEAYLRHKWFGAKVSAASYVVGEKATLAIDNSGGGDGISSVTGDGVVDLVAGGLDMSDPVSLATYGGSTYSATTGGVERTSSGGATLVKSGDGTLVVGEVSPDTARIEVQGGTLRLRQGVVDADSIPTNFCGYIEDPSFEAFADKNISEGGTRNLSTSSAMHGWKSVRGDYTYDSAVARYKTSGQSGDYYYALNNPSYSYPDGMYVGVLHITGGMQTTVTLPADGVYRLSYWLAQRPGYKGHEHRILIDDISVAQVKAWDSSSRWHLCTFRLPWLAAGEHTLVFASDANDNKDVRPAELSGGDTEAVNKNLVGMVDDIHVDWIESGEGLVAISNASFEVTSFCAGGEVQNPADLGGWEYVSTNELNYVFLDQTWNGQTWLHPASDGCRILNLVKQVQIGQDITFPAAGSYKLTFAAASTKQDVADYGGKLQFLLGGDEIGTLDFGDNGGVMKTYFLPFTVTADKLSAKLVIASLREKSVVSIDDIRIYRVGTSSVVMENSFASDGWSQDEPPSSINDGSGKVSWITRGSALDLVSWGQTEFDDGYRVGIRNNASIWRTVAFPAAGTYRLSIASIGRFYRYNNLHLEDPGILTRYSGNEFNVWVAKGGVTNVVGTFGVDDRERFVTHRFVFELPEGGDWEVGFSGLKESEHKIAGNSNWHSNGGVLDGLVIERVTAKAKPTLPKAAIEIADGATLALDYIGTNEVDTVRFAGRSYSGEINAQACPAFITGQGALFVQPKGTLIMFR